MRRDMEIIRGLMLNVEADKYRNGEYVHLDGVSEEICGYHAALIFDAGLAEGELIKCMGALKAARISRLTSSGHDFCDGIRQETIWNKVKTNYLKPGKEFGLSIIIEYVRAEVRKHIPVI